MSDALPHRSIKSRRDATTPPTTARIGIARSGGSVATAEALALQSAHAAAHDAVVSDMAAPALAVRLRAAGFATLSVQSRASDRATYIKRPDLGRVLDQGSEHTLAASRADGFDAVFIVADGLSASAVEQNAPPLLDLILPGLVREGWKLAPVVVASQARVALSDHVGTALGAKIAVILIGERPGLSSVDSMGIYVTWDPRPGRTDAERTCISNVRPRGLAIEGAAEQLHLLMNNARAKRVTGTALSALSESRPPSPVFLPQDGRPG